MTRPRSAEDCADRSRMLAVRAAVVRAFHRQHLPTYCSVHDARPGAACRPELAACEGRLSMWLIADPVRMGEAMAEARRAWPPEPTGGNR